MDLFLLFGPRNQRQAVSVVSKSSAPGKPAEPDVQGGRGKAATLPAIGLCVFSFFTCLTHKKARVHSKRGSTYTSQCWRMSVYYVMSDVCIIDMFKLVSGLSRVTRLRCFIDLDRSRCDPPQADGTSGNVRILVEPKRSSPMGRTWSAEFHGINHPNWIELSGAEWALGLKQWKVVTLVQFSPVRVTWSSMPYHR